MNVVCAWYVSWNDWNVPHVPRPRIIAPFHLILVSTFSENIMFWRPALKIKNLHVAKFLNGFMVVNNIKMFYLRGERGWWFQRRNFNLVISVTQKQAVLKEKEKKETNKQKKGKTYFEFSWGKYSGNPNNQPLNNVPIWMTNYWDLVFKPYPERSIQEINSFGPFEYQTCWIFG